MTEAETKAKLEEIAAERKAMLIRHEEELMNLESRWMDVAFGFFPEEKETV